MYARTMLVRCNMASTGLRAAEVDLLHGPPAPHASWALALAALARMALHLKRKLGDRGDTVDRYKRLTYLGQESHVSAAGLQKVLRAVEADGPPEAYSRPTQHRARKRLCATKTPYGSLIEHVQMSKGPVVAFQNPLAFMYNACLTCPEYSAMVRRVHSERPSTPDHPWNIVLY